MRRLSALLAIVISSAIGPWRIARSQAQEGERTPQVAVAVRTEVVGVVRDLETGSAIRQSQIYLPFTQRDVALSSGDGITVMVRFNAPTIATGGIRSEIRALDPNLAVFNLRTLNDYVERSRSSERFAVDTYGAIGIFSLVLAAIGLAGVTAYAVAQRRKEIGIRMALGARKEQVLGLVMREGLVLVGAGTALGFVGAFTLAKLLSSFTSVVVESLRIGTNDPLLLIGAPLLLAGLAALACYLPARRATEIDPLMTLREE
ncbi:MAG TPA: FtsX-like permease family protein [Gemmatimonadaceae bacterium]|nr:FtsX-like permease family protein [Gemmatimonadaceae bacterium]